MNNIQYIILIITNAWCLCSLELSAQSQPDFHQKMICNPCDIATYQKAYTNSIEDQMLFEFAHEQYRTYIKHKEAYTDTPRIPKIIHQIWIGPNTPPEKFKEWQQTWHALHPDWEYKLWTDKDVETLSMINKKYYDQEDNYAAKADILRLEILNQFGGLYVDVDFECLKSFDTLHHLCDFYIGFFQVNFLKSSARVNNAIIAACPHHDIIKQLIEQIKNNRGNLRRRKNKEIVNRTGPGYITKILKKIIYTSDKINVLLPANYFFPWTGTREELELAIQPETMAIHYYEGTWRKKQKNTTKSKTRNYQRNLDNRKKRRLGRISKTTAQ